jgi:hypothetical protein
MASLIFFAACLFRMDIVTVKSTATQLQTIEIAFDSNHNNDNNNATPNTPPLRDDDIKEKEPSTVTQQTPPSSNKEDEVVIRQPQYPIAAKLTKTATIVIQLSGELANNLHHIAHGIGLQQWSKDKYGIETNLVLRHYVGPNNRAPKPKWKSARDDIRKCFPTLGKWDITRGNSNEFTQRQRLQDRWLGKERMDRLNGLINSANETEMEQGLDFLANEILTDPNRPLVAEEEDEKDPIRLPFIYSNSLDASPMIDKYYSKIRKIFQFNDTACCAIVPTLDDSVFHFRNYQSEMPDWRAYEMGFQELSPKKTVDELFGHLQEGDQVKITTRIVNQAARNYVQAFSDRGINASLITDQTGVQDFCLLKRASKELAGSARSTFVLWAALLGDATTVRLYHVDNWGLRKRHPDYWERFTYSWTNPKLQARVKFELYQSEEMKGTT